MIIKQSEKYQIYIKLKYVHLNVLQSDVKYTSYT